MSETTKELVLVGVFLLMLFLGVAACEQRDDLKQQAVDRGYAEWVVKSNGETTWQWKEAAK